MQLKRSIFLLSVLAGLLFWLIDAVIDPALYQKPFLTVLFYGSSEHDLVMRAFIALSYLAFGLALSNILSKRVEAERALTEKTVYLDNILRSATEFAIATTDKDFRITYYNPLAEKIHGYRASEVIGKTVMEMHIKEKVEPERFQAAVENVKKHGEHVYMIKKETPEGTRHIEARVSGIFDKNGELVGYANFSHDVTGVIKAASEKEKLINDLQEALHKVNTLSGLLPICSYCKKIRDDKGYWSQIETYIRKHSAADFTHSICPDCEKKELKGLDEEAGGK